MTVKLTVMCDVKDKTLEDLNTFTAWVEDGTSSTCHKAFTSSSYSGCAFDPMDVFGPLLKFAGAVLIIAGIALVTYGSKFIFWALGFIIFVIVNGVLFGISYGLGVIKLDPNGTSTGPAIGTLIAGIILGIAAAYFGTKLA
jgi:hypothetical protein